MGVYIARLLLCLIGGGLIGHGVVRMIQGAPVWGIGATLLGATLLGIWAILVVSEEKRN